MPASSCERNSRAAATLFGLFRGSYEFQKGTLRYMSAFDAAKLDAAFNGALLRLLGPVGSAQRRRYLHPLRDLFSDAAGLQELLQNGLRLRLLGPDAHALEQRLIDAEHYARAYDKRRLQIYLVGAFPIRDKNASLLDAVFKLSVTGTCSAKRVLSDRWQLKRLQMSMSRAPSLEKVFILAFGAPIDLDTEQQGGFWHKVRDLPDSTIDLRVYVPSFRDRERERISIPFGSVPRFLRFVPGQVRCPNLCRRLLKLRVREYLFETAELTESGIRLHHRPRKEQQLALRFKGLLPHLDWFVF